MGGEGGGGGGGGVGVERVGETFFQKRKYCMRVLLMVIWSRGEERGQG